MKYLFILYYNRINNKNYKKKINKKMRPIVFIPTVKNKNTLETIICGCYFTKRKAMESIISKLVELNYISFSTYHSSNPNINHIDQFIQYLYHQMDELK
jgi:hypothetical protein